MERVSVEYDAEFAGRLYGGYLKSNRARLGFTLKQISRGLCSDSELSEIEKGKKNAGWLCRERLLLRAGAARDSHESYLGCDDYAEWKIQKEIIGALDRNDAAEMAAWLGGYADAYKVEKWKWDGDEKTGERKAETETGENVTERLRRQFYLGMMGMCRRLCAAPREELEETFLEAVQLTVLIPEDGSMYGMVLCPEEIHLVLEYARCLPFYQALRQCREIHKYLQSAQMDDRERVLNHPKVLLVLCQLLSEQKNAGIKTYEEIRELCGQGIDLLRKTKKVYYLLELLEMKKWSMEQIQRLSYQQKETDGKGEERAALFRKEMEEIEEWQECFWELYHRFGTLEGKNTDAWLYHRQDVYCIGDIVRIRRKMLRMTRREVYDGICSEDTLERLERKKKNTQPPILWDLCRRLRLSSECERTEIVTANPGARELEREIRYAANDGKFEENLERIEELKSLIDMSNKINQQWVLRTEGMAKYRIGQIDKEEYEKWLRRALERTLPWSVLELADEKECYLTNSEMACIYHLSLLDFPEKPQEAYEKMKIVFRVEHEFEGKGEAGEHIRSYELYEKYEAQIWNQLGEYEKSKEYAEKIIPLCLRMGRVNMLDGIFYEWVRSRIKLAEKETEPEREGYNWKRDLQYCLVLSRFCCDRIRENFLMEILSDQETQ